MRQQPGQIGLCATGQEQPGFLAEKFCRPRLKRVGGRILAINIITHFGGVNGRHHRLGRAGDRVTAEICFCVGAFKLGGIGIHGGSKLPNRRWRQRYERVHAAAVKRSMIAARIGEIDRTISRQMRAMVIDDKSDPGLVMIGM